MLLDLSLPIFQSLLPLFSILLPTTKSSSASRISSPISEKKPLNETKLTTSSKCKKSSSIPTLIFTSKRKSENSKNSTMPMILIKMIQISDSLETVEDFLKTSVKRISCSTESTRLSISKTLPKNKIMESKKSKLLSNTSMKTMLLIQTMINSMKMLWKSPKS